ncbi:MAG: LptE family protein [Bacteroidota bacterium]
MKNNTLQRLLTSPALIAFLFVLLITTGCGVYSFTGSTTNAKNISIVEFYNNADLGPANMGQTLTNNLKNYFIQNSNLSVVAEDGELQLEGEITDFRLTPIAPVSSGDRNDLANASSTRLTITVKATYTNTLDEKMSFKNKTFSFYKDFPNDLNFSDVEELYTKQIFERIINDIFNASVANW